MARAHLLPAMAAVIVTGLTVPLSAQVVVPFPPRPADPKCEQRLNAVLSLSPNVKRDSLIAVLGPLYACVPEIGRGIAAAAVIFRATADTANAMIILEAGTAYRDSAIFRASRSLAADPSASSLMRVSAMRVLLSYVSPAHVTGIDNLAHNALGARSCNFELAEDGSTRVVSLTPVTPSAAQEARDAARMILADSSAPWAVRSAAYCVVEAWRKTEELPGNAFWVFDPLKVSVENVCGARYRFRNMHPVPIALQYGIPIWPGKGRLTLPAPPAGASFSEITIDVGPGTLTMYLDGLPSKTVANDAGACS